MTSSCKTISREGHSQTRPSPEDEGGGSGAVWASKGFSTRYAPRSISLFKAAPTRQKLAGYGVGQSCYRRRTHQSSQSFRPPKTLRRHFSPHETGKQDVVAMLQ